MDISVQISKYKEKLLVPVEAELKELSKTNQLSVCLMALERLYTSYFTKYDVTGSKYFQMILETIENAISGAEIQDVCNWEQILKWCENCLDEMTDEKSTEWRKYSIEILFPEALYPLSEELLGVCHRKSPLDLWRIYQIGVDLCELYERDFLKTGIVDDITMHEFLAMRHEDVSILLKIVRDKSKAYKEKKIPRQEYFNALDELDAVCDNYRTEKQLYDKLKDSQQPKSPEDLILLRTEISRIIADITFLKESTSANIPGILKRSKAYRWIDILQLG